MIVIIKVRNADDTPLKKFSILKNFTVLDKVYRGPTYWINTKGTVKQNLVIESKSIYYNYSLELSMRTVGHDVEYDKVKSRDSKTIGNPLTLAYL